MDKKKLEEVLEYSMTLGLRRRQRLISMYMDANEAFKQYRAQVKERYDEEVDEEIYHELHVEHPDDLLIMHYE